MEAFMLKIMTLNLNYDEPKHGPWPLRRALIHKVLQQANPDIVAFQAVRRNPTVSSGIDQAAQLAGPEPGYPYVFFEPAMAYADGILDGSAILSRIPFAGKETLRLSRRPGTDDPAARVVLKASFDLPSGPFTLFNAHFSWVTPQARENVQETLPFIAPVAGPALLVGDLNNPPDAEPLSVFCEKGWCDVWATLHAHTPGYTFESHQPAIRIDYGWANPALKPHLLMAKILETPVNSDNIRFSDHLGLLFALGLTD
jgi:endonuclease/exonuclease/phosphatase family metal-dependent hydrolase